MRSEPRTAILHIGTPKTGTKAIQAALAAARPQLADNGVHYLEGDQNHSERLALCFWHEGDARRLACLRDTPGVTFRQSSFHGELDRELQDTSSQKVIFSAEGLCDFRPEEARRLLDFLHARFERVHIVAYLREPQSWMQSAGQQAVKWSGETLEAVFDAPRLPRYRTRLAPWISAVDRDDLSLRLYAGHGFDAVTDFCQTIGISSEFLPKATCRANAALSHTGAVALSAVNTASPPFIEYRHNPCRAYSVVDRCRLPGPEFQLPRETVEASTFALDDDRDWIRSMLGRDAFPSVDLPEVGRDAWFGKDRQMTEDLALRTAATCRSAQNEYAILSYLRAMKYVAAPERANALLLTAGKFATDRWSLGQIAEMAVQLQHPERQTFFAKQRLMRRIEDPEATDPPLAVGNPFDRFWTAPADTGNIALAG